MDEYARINTEYTTLRIGGGNVIFFTPRLKSYTLYRLRSKEAVACKVDAPLVNVQCLADVFVLFFESHHEEYDPDTLEKLRTVVKDGITDKYITGRSSAFLMRDDELIIDKSGRVPIVRNIVWAKHIGTEYLCMYTGDRLCLYKGKSRIWVRHVEQRLPLGVDVRNGKVYVLSGDRITGHDCNLFLDELQDFAPGQFTNLENLVLLFDRERRKLRIYQKNLRSCIFECEASDYAYAQDSELLVVMKEREEVVILQARNVYMLQFQLIGKSIIYSEEEDEFDESDSDHMDFRKKGRGRRKIIM